MKTADSKNTATPAKTSNPFFSKESGQGFFGSESRGNAFFRGSKSGGATSIQAKLNIGQPNDKYEKEADATADKVVQRLSTREVTPNNEPAIQAKPLISTITPLIQARGLNGEQEEKLQKKEDEDLVQESPLEIQRKPIFESNAEPPDEGNTVQRKCTACEEREKIQKKDKENQPEDVQLKVQRKSIFESNADPKDETIQRKCAECEREESLQKKGEGFSETNSSDIEDRLRASKGGGSPLPDATRSQMESSFGTDFSGVRVHTDSLAVQMNKELRALAFAHGSDVYFNSGKYDTGSVSGQHLLAHELTHTVQQSSNVQKKEQPQVQRSWLGDAWDSATDAVSDGWDAATGVVSDVASSVAGGLTAAWNTATTFLGDTAAAAWDGMKSLGSDALQWLSGAASYVWDGIKWFGSKAWDIIKVIGTVLWEKLCLLGNNVWSFIPNIPSRLWRIIIHGWDGIAGILGWVWDGLSGAAGHLWEAVKGVFGWLGSGISGAANWILEGVVAGYDWAVDFITAPSLSKLWNALTGTLDWLGKGISGFAQWGWDGIVGAAVWAWQGLKGFASWIWDGVLGGLTWAGKLLLYIIDLLGIFERLQLLWGLNFRMRKLTDVEINASLQVHPAGIIPYDQVYVDEGSLVAYISGYFSGGGYRAVTTAHIIHAAPGEDTATMVHELSHVAQYEHAGSVYMAQAIHAQAFGEGYNYINSDGTFKHQHFNEFNREQQASICEDYYKALNGGGGHASAYALQPFINEMRSGQF